MGFLTDVVGEAFRYVADFGPELREILALTLVVAALATAIGVVLGVPFGVWLGLSRFRGRGIVMAIVNTGMGIPPVLAGLLLLILLWNDGILGSWEALFTPGAMVAAQALLAFPIAAGVTAGAVRNLNIDAREQLSAFNVSPAGRGWIAGREVWPGVAAAVAAAFGRVIAEVGAVLVVGGNIEGETRVLTTAIVQEARQSNLGAALGLGIVLLAVALIVNLALTWAQMRGEARV
ncbi:MAG: ABC transporter permease subunit [bacterium]|nr:ABC transporter permease subunit [bacterium]